METAFSFQDNAHLSSLRLSSSSISDESLSCTWLDNGGASGSFSPPPQPWDGPCTQATSLRQPMLDPVNSTFYRASDKAGRARHPLRSGLHTTCLRPCLNPWSEGLDVDNRAWVYPAYLAVEAHLRPASAAIPIADDVANRPIGLSPHPPEEAPPLLAAEEAVRPPLPGFRHDVDQGEDPARVRPEPTWIWGRRGQISMGDIIRQARGGLNERLRRFAAWVWQWDLMLILAMESLPKGNKSKPTDVA